MPRAEKIGDLITASHKVLSEESESRNNHLYAAVLQVLTTRWVPTMQIKIFPGDPEELTEVLGADEETQSHLH